MRIEFEYDSKSFLVHKHNQDGADLIVCWTHNWQECPKRIEVIELSSLLDTAEQIDSEIKIKRQLTAWQKFCQEKRLEGFAFNDIAKLLRIPAQAATRFRFIPPPDSDSSRHPIPIVSAMGIRSIPPPPGRG